MRAHPPILLLAAALALGACGAEPEPEPEQAPRAPLRIALQGDPSLLDPHLQAEVVAQSVLGNVYEALVQFDGGMGLVPSLAERWSNPDDLVWRFYLRDGVRFHDGRELGADDVVASLDRIRNHPRTRSGGMVLALEEARAVDARTVELRTREPYPILLNKLAFLAIVPAGSPERIEHPVGTGPYRFLGRDEAGSIRLAAWSDHWRGPPPEPTAVYEFEADPAARARGLTEKRFDLISDLPAAAYEQVAASAELERRTRTSLVVTYLQMHLEVSPFDDPRVREAIDLAVDRRELVEKGQGGLGMPIGQMVSPNVFGHDPGLEVPAIDLDRSRSLLEEAGYADGLDLQLEIREGRPEAALIRDQLAAVGIRVEIVERTWSEMYPRLIEGKVGFYIGGWTCTSGDASDLLDQKVHSRDPAGGYGEAATAGIRDPELDELIERSATVLNMVQRRSLLQEALRRVAAQRALVGLFVHEDVYGASASLRWEPRQDGRVYAWEMSR